MRLVTREFGLVGVKIEKGNSNSSVDAFVSSGFKLVADDEYGSDLTDAEIDLINERYSGEIQEYAVEWLGCYWE